MQNVLNLTTIVGVPHRRTTEKERGGSLRSFHLPPSLTHTHTYIHMNYRPFFSPSPLTSSVTALSSFNVLVWVSVWYDSVNSWVQDPYRDAVTRADPRAVLSIYLLNTPQKLLGTVRK
jgi:hypothetical protein